MPTYQYACTECGHQLEAVQSFSDPALTDCPVCEGRLRKLFSSVGIVFKGSGFYRTDSRNGNGSTAANGGKSSKDSSTDSGSSASGNSSASTPSGSSDSGSGGSSSGSSGSGSGGASAAKATAAA